MTRFVVVLVICLLVLSAPMPGRGPKSRRRDVWRGFKFGARETVMRNANYRCEAPAFVAWGRCKEPASQVDHVVPWSRGGPTVTSNGQAICARHNRAKGSRTPPWWYVLGLERRRRRYFPKGEKVRVMAVTSESERTARQRSLDQRPGQRRRRR